jgi:hypothetical protein
VQSAAAWSRDHAGLPRSANPLVRLSLRAGVLEVNATEPPAMVPGLAIGA